MTDHTELLCELYQVLGALDAPAKVMDQVKAAMYGEELPYDTLLPFFNLEDEWKSDIRMVERPLNSNRRRKGYYLMYRNEILMGPFKSAQSCIEAKEAWVFP